MLILKNVALTKMCIGIIDFSFFLPQTTPSDDPSPPKDRGPFDGSPGALRSCKFFRNWLGNCSGLEDPNFGYQDGKPCVIIKLNRVLGFIPKASITFLFIRYKIKEGNMIS